MHLKCSKTCYYSLFNSRKGTTTQKVFRALKYAKLVRLAAATKYTMSGLGRQQVSKEFQIALRCTTLLINELSWIFGKFVQVSQIMFVQFFQRNLVIFPKFKQYNLTTFFSIGTLFSILLTLQRDASPRYVRALIHSCHLNFSCDNLRKLMYEKLQKLLLDVKKENTDNNLIFSL